MEELRLQLNGRGFRNAGGRLGIWTPAPALLLFHVVGHGRGEFAQPIIDEFDRLTASGKRVHLFVDLERMTNYDSSLRTRATEHFRAHLGSLENLHVLVQSRIVAMGVAVANLALRGLITSHSTRHPFKRALDNQLKEQRVVGFSSDVLAA